MLKKFFAAAVALAMLASFAYPASAAGGVRSINEIAGTQAESFSFIAAGDPQLGAGSSPDLQRAGWLASLTNAAQAWGDAAFLLTAGDNINTNRDGAQLAAFLEPLAETGFALAPTVGNHDPDILENFELPNRDGLGNYWYTYGNALFMHLNTNNGAGAIFKMAGFLRAAVRANPDAAWKFVIFHHTFYTAAASRVTSADGYMRRLLYAPLFDLFGIDMALMGHDHIYVRSKPMKFWLPCNSGTTYVTLNSSSGSKFYDMVNGKRYYTQVQLQPKAPMLTRIDVTPRALTLTTCRTDTMEVLDTCVITK